MSDGPRRDQQSSEGAPKTTADHAAGGPGPKPNGFPVPSMHNARLAITISASSVATIPFTIKCYLALKGTLSSTS